MSPTFSRLTAAALLMAAALPLGAQSGSTSVAALGNIYASGGNAGVGDGASPTLITLNAGFNRILSFSSITGSWSCNGASGYSADGLSSSGTICVGPANISATGGLSQLNTPNRSMTLVGVFLGASVPGSAPAAVDYSGGYNFASSGPLALGQVFFIGDGRTTDLLNGGTQGGAVQNFFVPDGATRLFLGVADACGFQGAPSCYGDNGGSLTVNYAVAVSAVPEPSTYALMAAGLAGIAALSRRRRRA